jgi:hypothetical protein
MSGVILLPKALAAEFETLGYQRKKLEAIPGTP